jgi:hypothetical protein
MVCSQFVYQCYEDAGMKYKLSIEGGVLPAKHEEGLPISNLLDQAIKRVRNDTSSDFRDFISTSTGAALKAAEEQSDEALADELLQALRSGPPLAAKAAAPLDDELVLAIHEFCQAVQTARTGREAAPNELLQANSLRMASAGMAQLKADEAYFVAPGDLLLHCSNLKKIGEIVS